MAKYTVNERKRRSVLRQLKRRGLTPSSSTRLRDWRRQVEKYDKDVKRALKFQKAVTKYNARMATESPAKFKYDKQWVLYNQQVYGPDFKREVNRFTKRLLKEARRKPPRSRRKQVEVAEKIMPQISKSRNPGLRAPVLISKKETQIAYRMAGERQAYLEKNNTIKKILAMLGQFRLLRWAGDNEMKWAYLSQLFKNDVDRLMGNPYTQASLEGVDNLYISKKEGEGKAYTVDNAFAALMENEDFTFENVKDIRFYHASGDAKGRQISFERRFNMAKKRGEYARFKTRWYRDRDRIRKGLNE